MKYLKPDYPLGFIQFNRGYDQSIHKHPMAFNLLAIIAQRAKRTESFHNRELKIGQALIGDYENYGMTRQQYRSAIKWLKSTNLITIKTSSKGTIAKIITTTLFDINIPLNNHQANQLTNQRATNHQPLTNNDKNENKENKSHLLNEPAPLIGKVLPQEIRTDLWNHAKGSKNG